MVTPLFVVDRDGWLSVFESPEQAQAHLESTDIEDHEYVGYDAEGEILALSVDTATKVRGGEAGRT